MNLLLDECLDRRLAGELPGHFVRTVPQMGWAGVKNGELMALAEQAFDVFITVDRNLSFQQAPSSASVVGTSAKGLGNGCAREAGPRSLCQRYHYGINTASTAGKRPRSPHYGRDI